MLHYKKYIIGVICICLFVFAPDAFASVSCDFGSGFTVLYTDGVPNPTEAVCTMTIENDESTPLTVLNLEINSTSMAFVQLDSGSSDWACSYTQTSSAPDFTGQTICAPTSSLILTPGDNTSFDMRFSFENTSGGSHSPPSYVGLNDISLNGVKQAILNANLGNLEWNIDAIDENADDTNNDGIVRGYVYFDDNANGQRDDGEEGIEDIKMKLKYAGKDDTFDTNDDVRYTDKTNEYGKYHFNNLSAGKYRLKIADGQMTDFYLTAEKDEVNGKSHFSLKEDETKERDFGYDRNRNAEGVPKNTNMHYLQSGFYLSLDDLKNYFVQYFFTIFF